MTLGDKIRKYRTLQDMTQKDLGLKAGFSAATADSRIRKYEKDIMAPKYDIRQKLIEALDVDPSALSDINIESYEDIMQVFFLLEDELGLEIERNDETTSLILKNDNPINKSFDLVAEEYFNYLKEYRKQSTIETYKQCYNRHIYPYFRNFYINRVNTQDIKKWAEKMLKMDYSNEYLNKVYSVLKNIFDYAIKNYNLEHNPVVIGRFKNKTIQKDEDKLRYITKEEFDKFIEVIDIPIWHAFFTTLYYTGARKGELLALTWNDINFNKKEISINKTLNTKLKGQIDITPTKNYLNRTIKMSKTLYDELYSYYKEQKSYTDYKDSWFVFNGSTYLPLTTIDRYKHKYFELSGVHEITIHEFRHSHVSLLINEYLKSII